MHTLPRLGLGQANNGTHGAARQRGLEDALGLCMLLLAAQGLPQQAQRCGVMAPTTDSLFSSQRCISTAYFQGSPTMSGHEEQGQIPLSP